MKMKFIKWGKINPGTLFGIKDTFYNIFSSDTVNYQYRYYFIKYDDLINELVFYDTYEQKLKRFPSKSKDFRIDNLEFDILTDEYNYFQKPEYKCLLDFSISENHCVVFKDSILKGNKFSKRFEFFKIIKLKNDICDLESISSGYKLKNINICSISPASKIFININKLSRNIIDNMRIDYKSVNYNLVIKQDKCHRNIFVLVYDNLSKKYSIELIKPDLIVSRDISKSIENKINNCIDLIENSYTAILPDKKRKYKRINYKNKEEESIKFDLKNISCFYDLYFENFFTDQKILKHEKESIIDFINTSSVFYK